MKRFLFALTLAAILLWGCGGTPPDSARLTPLEEAIGEWDDFAAYYGRETEFFVDHLTVTNCELEIPDTATDVQVSDWKTGLWERLDSVEQVGTKTYWLTVGKVHLSTEYEGKEIYVAWTEESQ